MGNKAFQNKNFEEAIKHYNAALEIDPRNHILFSNRCSAYLSLEKFELAIQDADTSISLNQKWGKVLVKKVKILLALNRLDDVAPVLESYEKVLDLYPEINKVGNWKVEYEEILQKVKEKRKGGSSPVEVQEKVTGTLKEQEQEDVVTRSLNGEEDVEEVVVVEEQKWDLLPVKILIGVGIIATLGMTLRYFYK